jgi:DNA-binding transcriptional MerR regulator
VRGRRLGFSLEEIGHILNMYDQEPGEVGQLQYLLEQIRIRRVDLERRRADLDVTLAELGDLARRCEAHLARLEHAPGAEAG